MTSKRRRGREIRDVQPTREPVPAAPALVSPPATPVVEVGGFAWTGTAVTLGLILLVTAAVYSSSFANGFLNWDDPANVTQNPLIRSLSWQNLGAYFTTPLLGMYTPLVYLSFAFDYLAGGLSPIPYHLTNLALHLVNVALVFAAVLALAKNRVAAAVAAALFAVHPMNVAAVTPVSVRSSLLYSCFYLGAWLAYIRHVQRGSRLSLWVSFALFVLSALSKSAAVVFPLLMLATDWFSGRPIDWRSLARKWAFFLVAAAFGVLTFVFREDTAGLQSLPVFAIWERIFLATYTLGFYVVKLVAPFALSPHYAYPDRIGGHLPLVFFVSPLLVAAGAWLLWRLKSYRRVLLFAGLFFLVHIVLVLKIVPLGAEFAADRYVYLPSIGLFLVVGEACRRWSGSALKTVAALAAVAVVGLSVVSYGRSGDWHDNLTFYGKIIALQPSAAVAWSNRGAALIRDANDPTSAIPDLNRAIELDAGYADAYYNRGTANMLIGRPGAALSDVMHAIALRPGRSEYHQVNANARLALRDYKGAIEEANATIALNPHGEDVYMAYESRGIASALTGNPASAIRDFTSAIALDPTVASVYQNRGNARVMASDTAGALSDYNKAIELNPRLATAYRYRGQLKAGTGDLEGGCADLRTAAGFGLEAARAMVAAQCR